MKVVGFTGTRKGLNEKQESLIVFFLTTVTKATAEEVLIRHGDCIGADAEFHKLAQKAGLEIELHPSNLKEQRAFCKGAKVVHEPKHPLERNHDIVDSSDILVAAPGEVEERLRSGTWATIRYALRKQKVVILITPDGKLTRKP